MVGKFIIPANFIILYFDADEQVQIILGCPFFATGGALIDVIECMLKKRVEGKNMVFDVYNAPKIIFDYIYLCINNVIEGDKCWVLSLPKTSLDYLIEQPKFLPPKPDLIQIDEPEMAKVEESAALKNFHPRGVKRIKRQMPKVKRG